MEVAERGRDPQTPVLPRWVSPCQAAAAVSASGGMNRESIQPGRSSHQSIRTIVGRTPALRLVRLVHALACFTVLCLSPLMCAETLFWPWPQIYDTTSFAAMERYWVGLDGATTHPEALPTPGPHSRRETRSGRARSDWTPIATLLATESRCRTRDRRAVQEALARPLARIGRCWSGLAGLRSSCRNPGMRCCIWVLGE